MAGRAIDISRSELCESAQVMLPGIGLAALAATISSAGAGAISTLAEMAGWSFAMPAVVVAVLVGIAISPMASAPVFEKGLDWCVKLLLRIAVALLGLRVLVTDLVAIGPTAALVIAAGMIAALVAGPALGSMLRTGRGYGALAGVATAICGASAALALASATSDYPNKRADLAFTIVAANLASTVVMILYPLLASGLGLSADQTAILLGATIHDMAQVVGAGYAVSDAVGTGAVVVKLLRIALLLPVVVVLAWWLRRGHRTAAATSGTPPALPGFVVGFSVLVVLNNIMASVPALAPVHDLLRGWAETFSSWAMLMAIAALGLRTSLTTLAALGVGHIVVFAGTSMVLLLVCLGCLTVLS